MQRPMFRILRHIEFVQLRACDYSQFPTPAWARISRTCRTASLPASNRKFTSTSSRRVGEPEKLSLDERLRRKLWGKNVDSVPGPDQSNLGEQTQDWQLEDEWMKDYKPALDGRGLKVLGMEEEEKDWTVMSFANQKKAMSPAGIYRAVHRAVVEVYTNVLNGYPGDRACQIPARFSTKAVGGDVSEKDLTEEVAITFDMVNKEFKFDYGSEEFMQMILKSSEVENGAGEDKAVEDKAAENQAVDKRVGEAEDVAVDILKERELAAEPMPVFKGGDIWKDLPFSSNDIKFAVFKRTIQLTGHRVSDNSITQMKHISHLLNYLITPPPPAKLSEALLSDDSELTQLPNVKVYAERLRPLDRERMIGRLSPAQEEFLYEKARLERGEVDEKELDDYRYAFQKRGYI